MSRIIFSLDIGCSKIVACVGVVDHDSVEIHGISTYYFTNNNRGNDFLFVRNGVICNLDQIVNIVTQMLNEARIEADCSIGGVITNIAGNKVCSLYSTNVFELHNQTITVDVIRQLIDTARQKEVPSQYEMLDYEVQEYLVDGENYAINPLNLTAKTLQSNLNLFFGDRNQIENIKKVLSYSNFGLLKIVPSGVLSGMAVLNHEEKELGCCLIDIGAGTTDIVVYENVFIRYLASLPIGGEDITRDLASVLKISRNLAEDIKINYGSCSYLYSVQKSGDGITLINHRGVNQVISRKLVIDIIVERLRDIFKLIKTGLNHRQLYDIISSGVVITGGVAKLPEIESFASQYFGLPVRVGIPNYASSFADLVTTPNYATSIGVLYFAKEYMLDAIDNKVSPISQFQVKNFKSITQRFKKLFA